MHEPHSLPALRKLDEPDSYFKGIRSHNVCHADNIVIFVRRKREILRQNSFEARPHHRFVLLTVLQTAGSVNVDGSIYRMEPGRCFLIAPYQFHFYMDIESESICWHYLTFESNARSPYELILNTPIALGKEGTAKILKLSHDYAALGSSDSLQGNLFILSVNQFLNEIRLVGQKQSGPHPIMTGMSGYELVEQVNQLLSAGLGGISVTRIAESLTYSESHLRKRFKALTGLSLGSYLIHYKLNYAVKLLVHSKSSLTDIAERCGYESLAAFSRSFRSNLGSAPSEYRRKAIPSP